MEQEKDREKGKVGGRPVKLNEKNGERDLEQEIEKKETFFCWNEQHENFVAPIKCKVQMSGSEKK